MASRAEFEFDLGTAAAAAATRRRGEEKRSEPHRRPHPDRPDPPGHPTKATNPPNLPSPATARIVTRLFIVLVLLSSAGACEWKSDRTSAVRVYTYYSAESNRIEPNRMHNQPATMHVRWATTTRRTQSWWPSL